MYEQLVVATLGFATIFDAVLLLFLFERVNSNQVAVWLRLLVVGVFAIHASSFMRAMQLQPDLTSINRLDRICFSVTAFGLLLLPSAMLHAAIRLNHTGPIVRPKTDVRYALLYVPMAFFPLVIWDTIQIQGTSFLDVFRNVLWPYMGWLAFSNWIAVVLFIRVRKRFSHESFRKYFVLHSLLLCAITALAFAYVIAGYSYRIEPILRVASVLSLLAPLFLFVWYSLKAKLLTLVMERTLIYGAALLAVLVLLRATVLPWVSQWNAKSDFDWLIVEMLLAATVILAWRPLRIRVLESLRYLFSNNVFLVRDATRALSVRLTRLSSLPAGELIDQFENAVRIGMEVQSCNITISHPSEWKRSVPDEQAEHWDTICREFQIVERGYFVRGWGLPIDVDAAMEKLDIMWVFPFHSGMVRGAVTLGTRIRCDRFAEEQLTALSLLFEQFASTLENRWIDAQRIRAERMAMHQEKLSALGLMSSSLAHEIRNPLSSIRTIATVALEECQQNKSLKQDLEMILSEIDRLSCTTQQLLSFARPNQSPPDSSATEMNSQWIHPHEVIENSLYVLNHMARQSQVELTSHLCEEPAAIHGSRWMLSEVVFNLLRNAIEATQGINNGVVTIRTIADEQSFVIEVCDNGPGISPEVQSTMYHPFFTDKETGTGLGLYVVQERIKEMHGTLQCESELGRGTIFRVQFSRELE